ncbi:MAG: hypothetical protein ABJP34_09365 [Erythrobacter sp.]
MKAFLSYSAAFSILATLASVAANHLLFRNWGLSFASIASSEDVFLGGVNVVTRLLENYYFSALVGIALGIFVPVEKVVKFLDGRSPSLLIFIPIVLLMPATWGNEINSTQLFWVAFYDFILPILAFFFLALAFRIERTSFGYSALAIMFTLMVVSILKLSLLGSANLMAVVTSENCGGPEKQVEWVVWLGSETTVTTCSNPPFTKSHVFLIKPREGKAFLARPNSSKVASPKTLKRRENAQKN